MADDSGFQVEGDAPRIYDAQVARFMAPFVAALVAACVRPGDAVLDVACGTGFAARAAADAAGEGARVAAVDLNPAMIAHARSVTPSTRGIEWREASALELPYDDATFDVVLCQQGLQFFPDPVAGLREMARVLRPGGRLGATVWAASERSFLELEADMVARYGGHTPPCFSSTEDELRTWGAQAGLTGVSTRPVTAEVDLPPMTTYVPEHLRALPWSAAFLALPVDRQRAAIDELAALLGAAATTDGIRVPFRSHLLTAAGHGR